VVRFARRHGDRGQAGPLILVLVLFAVLAALVYVNNQNPEIRRINLVAQQYADAWRTGRLDGLEYDELSGPDVTKGDPAKIADNVKWIVNGLDGAIDKVSDMRPEKVEVDRGTTQRGGKGDNLATVKLWVTWKLQPTGLDQSAHYWTYPVTVQERLLGGRWRVVWAPQSVHPAIRHGLVLKVTRSVPARGGLLGAGDTPLPPNGSPNLAKGLLGSIAAASSHEQAELAALRAKPGEPVGVAGLQDLYDERLAGSAGVQVVASAVQGYAVTPPSAPLYVGPPETPKPLKVTLDRRTQQWAEQALGSASAQATLVVVKASTGELLAVANTAPTGTAPAADYGLSSQQPPGPVFGLASTLALLRSPAASQQTQETYQLTTRIDCSQPYTVGGQVFRNTQGPNLAGVQLGAAVEGGCVTGLARVSADVTPKALQTAAYDLGLATPKSTSGDAPGLLTVADQLGTPAFHGTVPPTDEEPETDAVHHAENMVGEGQVLVSPLSMARAVSTVASGTRRSVRLIVDPPARQEDQPKDLNPGETEALRLLLSKGVTEQGGSAHALAALGDVHALAGTAGYGTGKGQRRQAWCVGYLGDYAFAVLVPNAGGNATQAVTIASKFLDATR
jgi:hypothetical protein